MQRIRNGEIEHISLYGLIEPHRPHSPQDCPQIPTECRDCEVDRCFYLIHRKELGSRVLTDCERLTRHKSLGKIDRDEMLDHVWKASQEPSETQKMIRQAAEAEERQRLLKILFDQED